MKSCTEKAPQFVLPWVAGVTSNSRINYHRPSCVNGLSNDHDHDRSYDNGYDYDRDHNIDHDRLNQMFLDSVKDELVEIGGG